MNCEVFSLSPLRCEPFQVKEVMRAVLHTILFSRTLGVVRPRDVDSELFDLTYAMCGDAGVCMPWGRERHDDAILFSPTTYNFPPNSKQHAVSPTEWTAPS